MTVHEQHHAVTSALRSNDPAHQLAVATAFAERGKLSEARLLAEQAVKVINQRDIEQAIRRRA